MLTPEQIEALRDAASHITDPINDYLIGDIARRISEAGQLTSTAAYEVWMAQQLGTSQRQVKKEVRKRLKVSNRELKKLMTQAAEVGYDFDLKRLPVQAVPFRANESLQQIVAAAVELAGKDLNNITQTLGMVDPFGKALPLQDVYRSCTDFAFKQVITGASDYNTAIRTACANIAKYGVRTIDYESGVHTSLEAAVRRNIMGGLGLMNEQIEQVNHDEMGCNGWEISAHANSAPDHEPIQGKQYSDAEYTALNNSLVRRIGTLNCGHVAFPIILGINSPQYSDAELTDLRRQNDEVGITYQGKHYTGYEATQMQRKIERSIRVQKNRILVDKATGDADKRTIDQIKLHQIKLRQLNEEYRRFSQAAGLRTESERTWVVGFSREQATRANIGAEQYYQKWSKEISVNSSIETLAKYYDVKYTNSPRYERLQGYAKAVEKGDISPLVGFDLYEEVSAEIRERLVGATTSTGITIESFTTHFVDRVIGQTSTPHKGMRCGVSIEDALDALLNPIKLDDIRLMDDGDIRQTLYGSKAAVTISVRDKRLIQTNPNSERSK